LKTSHLVHLSLDFVKEGRKVEEEEERKLIPT
jgi:hypothetical protein